MISAPTGVSRTVPHGLITSRYRFVFLRLCTEKSTFPGGIGRSALWSGQSRNRCGEGLTAVEAGSSLVIFCLAALQDPPSLSPASAVLCTPASSFCLRTLLLLGPVSCRKGIFFSLETFLPIRSVRSPWWTTLSSCSARVAATYKSFTYASSCGYCSL